MNVLSKKYIVESQGFNKKIITSAMFLVAGVLITLSPIMYLKVWDFNSVIGIVVCLIFFGLPFGAYFGAKDLIYEVRRLLAMNNNSFNITIDKVIDKQMLNQDAESDERIQYCQLCFEKHSAYTNKNYKVSRSVFEKTREGDEFYMVYIGDLKNVVDIYPKKKFTLDNELKSYLKQ